MESCTGLPASPLSDRNKPLFTELEKFPFVSQPCVNSHDLRSRSNSEMKGDPHKRIITGKGVPVSGDIDSSAVSSPASSPCHSPFAKKVENTGSYLQHSSLEASPSSSPNSSSYLEDEKISDMSSPSSKYFFSRRNSEEKMVTDQEGNQVPEGKVPKNIKLPQRKGGMQLWQFLYALLNDQDKKYSKLIEWTANSPSREFRLLEPEAIAIWWGEHKNKKNMSYDKLSRSLRYYYDKGIIRKISGERYVYQFCIDPEVMYKHIGNSDSRPKLKPMPQSAHHATSEYQSQHGFTSCGILGKDPCFIAQGPLPIGMVHGQLLPTGSHFPPPLNYGGMTPFPHHGYSDVVSDLHAPPLHNGTSFYPGGYDQMTPALPSMAASLGYPHMEAPPMKMQFPVRKQSYDMPGLTAACIPKFESEASYGHALVMPSNNMSTHNSLLSPQTSLSPPPLTSSTAPSNFSSQESPLPTSYSNQSSPRVYGEETLAFEEFIPYSASEDYSLGPDNVIYAAHNSAHGGHLVENSWD